MPLNRQPCSRERGCHLSLGLWARDKPTAGCRLPAVLLDKAAEVKWLHAIFWVQLLRAAAKLFARLSVLPGLKAHMVVSDGVLGFMVGFRVHGWVSGSGLTPRHCTAASKRC